MFLPQKSLNTYNDHKPSARLAHLYVYGLIRVCTLSVNFCLLFRQRLAVYNLGAEMLIILAEKNSAQAAAELSHLVGKLPMTTIALRKPVNLLLPISWPSFCRC